MRPVTGALAESSGSLLTLHSSFSQSIGIAVELDLSLYLYAWGRGSA